MHFVVDPGPIDAGPKLEVLQGSTVLAACELVRPNTGGFTRNVSGYQPPEGHTQHAAGDGRTIVGERTIDVLVTGTSMGDLAAALKVLADALVLATSFRYDGITVDVAGGRGVTSTQPVGNRAVRATIAYYPVQQASWRGGVPVLGPI